LRICIVAEHASYRFGGEAILPVHFFAGLRARGVDAWLVVHSRTREELLAAFPEDAGRMRFITDTWYHKLLFRLSGLLPRRVAEASIGLFSQLTTQYAARKIARELIRTESVNLIHQPIPVSPRFPSLMSGLRVPVVIGPMNGGMEYPAAFRHQESAISRAAIRIGRMFSNFFNARLPGKKLARVLLVANQRTRAALPEGFRGEVVELPENGVHLKTWSAPAMYERNGFQPAGKQRFVFIGRLVDWKCVDIAIEALSHLPQAELTILGDGPMHEPWQALAEKLGIADRVTFAGWIPQTECAPYLHASLALLLPSVYECGGAVVLEAMASGIPVIATNWGGPADYLDNTSGFLIEPTSREEIVRGFTAAMQELIATPGLRDQLGACGRQRVEQHFDWEKKIDRILEIYQRVLTTPSQKPGVGVV
jgi:glycosyltransferase involved in cell wall biosynthesis